MFAPINLIHQKPIQRMFTNKNIIQTTSSAIKNKFGEIIKSKDRVAQVNELLCKIVAYNITVLIHEMIQLNGTSEFLSFTGLTKEVSMAPSDFL